MRWLDSIPDTSGEILPLKQHIDWPSNTVISDRESQVSRAPRVLITESAPSQPAPAQARTGREAEQTGCSQTQGTVGSG